MLAHEVAHLLMNSGHVSTNLCLASDSSLVAEILIGALPLLEKITRKKWLLLPGKSAIEN